MCSAIRKVYRVLNQDPESVPADPARLRVLLTAITPAAAGVTTGSWANTRSRLLKALRHAKIRSMPGRYRDPLMPEWEAHRGFLPDRRDKAALSSAMSYFSANDIPPAAVTAETFAQFGAELMATSLKRDPGGVYRDSCKVWNWAARTVPAWPQVQVPVPDRRRRFALPLNAFPQSFQADLHRFLAERANPDVFSDSYCKPVRPLTTRGRQQKILMAATTLVTSGFPVEGITMPAATTRRSRGCANCAAISIAISGA